MGTPNLPHTSPRVAGFAFNGETDPDAKLIASWREWLHALDAEMSATDERESNRRHIRVEAILQNIIETPSKGLLGIGLKLALANFLGGFEDGVDGEPAISAYLDTVRLLDRDFLAEAEAVVERARELE